PQLNPTVGTPNATGPANYWPLWSDGRYFPVPANPIGVNWASALNAAYQTLVGNIPATSPLTAFANIIGTAVTNPTVIQRALDSPYRAPYGPPPTPPDGPGTRFPVQLPPGTTPQEAVYGFLYNANLLRQTFHDVLSGDSPSSLSLTGWVQEVINGIGGQSS